MTFHTQQEHLNATDAELRLESAWTDHNAQRLEQEQ